MQRIEWHYLSADIFYVKLKHEITRYTFNGFDDHLFMQALSYLQQYV